MKLKPQNSPGGISIEDIRLTELPNFHRIDPFHRNAPKKAVKENSVKIQ